MFACPYFKHNPSKYVQRKWKSCAYPGYGTIHRLKGHIYRKHMLPDYQCKRYYVNVKSFKQLEELSNQMEACTPIPRKHDGLSQAQVKRMRIKKDTRKKTEEDKWNDTYAIALPHDQNTPSPYLRDSDEDTSVRKVNLLQEYSRFLERELPQLVGRDLSTIGCSMPDTIRVEIERRVEAFITRLQASFLDQAM
ncbi:hypothetical protein Forpe1208_v012202 [Fusarium oxysporum f. sp. rapae]|uniref:C2H2-type domain-containing protein n=1 Tax=Fusarium oxysporum f. sp. rapae TaxID=485398 RepID=A0A8J5NVK6_FUSOX|nr:hypothetical protein Forpe1208_v012202 [Fusarium oxysporum f. sp. rapae]